MPVGAAGGSVASTSLPTCTQGLGDPGIRRLPIFRLMSGNITAQCLSHILAAVGLIYCVPPLFLTALSTALYAHCKMAIACTSRPCSYSRGLHSSASKAIRIVPSVRWQRGSLKVAAVQQQDSNTDPSAPQGSINLQSIQKSYDRFREKYENSILSAGVGALMVTTYCVLKGQSPLEAAGITACATVMALVLNEVLFSDEISS